MFIDRKGGWCADKKRVTIWRCLSDEIRPDIAPCTATIFNQKWLAQLVSQTLCQKPRNNVVRSAGGERHNEPHGPFWPSGLRQNLRCWQ
jgi:hypothetical protein